MVWYKYESYMFMPRFMSPTLRLGSNNSKNIPYSARIVSKNMARPDLRLWAAHSSRLWLFVTVLCPVRKFYIETILFCSFFIQIDWCKWICIIVGFLCWETFVILIYIILNFSKVSTVYK